jgi:hypothetical protein
MGFKSRRGQRMFLTIVLGTVCIERHDLVVSLLCFWSLRSLDLISIVRWTIPIKVFAVFSSPFIRTTLCLIYIGHDNPISSLISSFTNILPFVNIRTYEPTNNQIRKKMELHERIEWTDKRMFHYGLSYDSLKLSAHHNVCVVIWNAWIFVFTPFIRLHYVMQ